MKRLMDWKDLLNEERMMDLEYVILDIFESWNTKGNYQEWHNTTSNDMVERIALRNARWRNLISFEMNLDEHFEKELNPWWPIM